MPYNDQDQYFSIQCFHADKEGYTYGHGQCTKGGDNVVIKCRCACHLLKPCPKCGSKVPIKSQQQQTSPGSFTSYIKREKALGHMTATYIEEDATMTAVAVLPTCIMCKTEVCSVCGLCETATCALIGKLVTTRAELVELGYLTAQTQKAKGYGVIAKSLNVPKPFRVISDAEDIEPLIKNMPIPVHGLFARPCPVRPRHGFVESRPLKSTSKPAIASELASILKEAKAADPDAELLVVPTIKATHNIILTPSRLAVGIGNDGATAGKRSTVFPLSGVKFYELPKSLVRAAGVAESEDPYIEVVLTGSHHEAYSSYVQCELTKVVYFTQLRAGVRIPPAVDKDFVPDRMVVDKVIEASGDLLEWERQVQEEIKPGTAVYHLGGTLISHYGVHCVFNNIPIFTSRVPEIGEMLIPTAKPERPSAESIAQGLAIGASKYIGLQLNGLDAVPGHQLTITCPQAATLLLVASHNAAAMGGESGMWIGLAAALMMRLGMAASHGEARHRGQDGYAKNNRSFVYNLALNDFFGARDALGYAQWRFRNCSWDGGYGGKKWAACTDSIFRLDKAAQAVMIDKTDEAVTEIVTALHNAINQAHNGGWWLNKFVQQNIFDHTCSQSMYSLSLAAPTILAVTNLERSEDVLKEVIEQWATSPVPKIERGKIVGGQDVDVAKVLKDGQEPDEASDDDDDEDSDSTDSSDDDEKDFDYSDKCSNKSCVECYPEESADTDFYEPPPDKGPENKSSKYTFSEDHELEAAQGRMISLNQVHVQYKIKGVEGYLSCDPKLEVPKSKEQVKEIAKLCTLSSLAGTNKPYFPLQFEKADGKWKLWNPDANIVLYIKLGDS